MKEINKQNIYVSPQDHLDMAITLMTIHKVSGLAVVEKGKLVGILSAKDFLKTLVSVKYLNGHLGHVVDYMVENPKTILEDSQTHSVVDIFVKEPFHYYPVVDKDHNYKGTIYRSDLLEAVSKIPQTTW